MTEVAILREDRDGPAPVRVRVPAKINLHLGVGDRRPDGFHDLTTVYQAVSLYDEVIAEPAGHWSAEVTGEGAGVLPVDERNLAVRAALLLANRAGVPAAVRLRLHKRIPLAGGLAGGSADAAGTLLACARLWELDLTRDELVEIAADLGSDVPFCLLGSVALGTGHGERVEPVDAVGQYHWVVAVADGELSTPAVYGEVDRLRDNGIGRYHDEVAPLLSVLAAGGDADRLGPLLHNDMAEAAVSLRPGLAEVLAAGASDGAVATLVSGSGPTVLYLARDEHHGHALAARLRLRGLARQIHYVTGPVAGAVVC
ncbi:4-diphosphocytidyl-2-C-methyl-D-erythritol kinase [Stackebrandtia endophytica]|uniref:4-diphosphocytidyl-2-C-methyl-D-erythritol kinase n=1 Tax=Stackebrandtia endophytica TaxID=1496996 RepID=A0A543AVF5_9ACTN|nr:4-(cytidine 5'-diphospho)-2-C-methyl-D-erythritol kinase [Stackebrandtia endophytica]TQL76570.1 4-diphosphocytidyl-2-C-methyl-D-erythritol kinase [Stackebrandtia endophytica]